MGFSLTLYFQQIPQTHRSRQNNIMCPKLAPTVFSQQSTMPHLHALLFRPFCYFEKKSHHLFLMLVKYTQHAIYHFNTFKKYNSVRLSTQCCATIPLSSSKTLSSPQKETVYPLRQVLSSLVVGFYLQRLTYSEYFCERIHTMYGFFPLPSFNQHNVSKIHPHRIIHVASVLHSFSQLTGTLLYGYTHILFIHVMMDNLVISTFCIQ